ncbi:hypothetical protein N7510_000786 [Penicillium lagena]|uniref:uncharacterized protein n=1 Tax=Penicillium lagena TaxID=94218 RepID=UPI0025414EFA|nr:uncharacterized protein N7510_000786 [Penicillium lagena]KAJ5624477.1 hypothetical protein N7510_000786 [Penicillium lagena]
MSRNADPRLIGSPGSDSGSPRHLSTSSPPGQELSSSAPAPSSSFSPDTNNYDTALPPISNFTQSPIAHRRTGSTLKTVMRKIFTRKRQSQPEWLEESPHEAHYSALSPRKSGPEAEGKSFLVIPTPTPPSESKRSSPLSEQNLNLAERHLSPTTASHSPLGSPGFPPRRRRATLPSVVFSDDESRYDEVAPSAVSDPQDDCSYMPDPSRPPSMLHARRRSRSTEALRRLASDDSTSTPFPSKPRHTRQPSSKTPRGSSSASGQSRRPSTGTAVTSVTRGSADPSLPDSDQHAEQISLPPNVGNLVHTMQQDDSLTLEQRLTTLEVKLIDLEFAIARMQSHSIDSSTNSAERSSRQKHAPPPDPFSPFMRNKPSFLGSEDRDNSPSPMTTTMPGGGRPLSTATIRPETMQSRTVRAATSTTSLSDYNGVSIEQYSALITLLRREQTARRNLETQVAGLRDDIRHVQRAALHSMELGTMYPIHSAESQEFLRFRRALDDSDTSSPIHASDEKPNGGTFDSDSDWDRSDSLQRDDPFGYPKWERGQRVVTAPMI